MAEGLAVEFDDPDQLGGPMGNHPPEEAESYFSSHIHSSSETINSELIMAYQQAIRQNGGRVPEQLNSHPARSASSTTGLGAQQISQNILVLQQDKSPIKVPTLDFDKLQEQLQLDKLQEQEMQQELHVQDQQQHEFQDSQELQDMQDLVDNMDAGNIFVAQTNQQNQLQKAFNGRPNNA